MKTAGNEGLLVKFSSIIVFYRKERNCYLFKSSVNIQPVDYRKTAIYEDTTIRCTYKFDIMMQVFFF